MGDGVDGILRFAVAQGGEVTLPPVPGETDKLPDGVRRVDNHDGQSWSGTGDAYLPPCSGGRGHRYTADVKAGSTKSGWEAVLGAGTIALGTY